MENGNWASSDRRAKFYCWSHLTLVNREHVVSYIIRTVYAHDVVLRNGNIEESIKEMNLRFFFFLPLEAGKRTVKNDVPFFIVLFLDSDFKFILLFQSFTSSSLIYFYFSYLPTNENVHFFSTVDFSLSFNLSYFFSFSLFRFYSAIFFFLLLLLS